LASRHQTQKEIKNRTPIFQTKWWEERKLQKKAKNEKLRDMHLFRSRLTP